MELGQWLGLENDPSPFFTQVHIEDDVEVEFKKGVEPDTATQVRVVGLPP